MVIDKDHVNSIQNIRNAMYSPAYLLAWRYLFGRKEDRSISTMIYICFFGILIGTFAFTLSMCIMNGFEHATQKQLQGIQTAITMHAYGDELDIQKIESVITKEFSEIKAISPYTTQQLIIQDPTTDDISHVVGLKAIDPEQEQHVSTIEQKIVTQSKNLQNSIDTNHILIGKSLAEQLELSVGDTVNLLFTKNAQNRSHTLKLHKEQAIIGGIFKTGIDEFDAGMIFGSFDLLHTLFPEQGATHISIKPKLSVDHDQLVQKLRKRFEIEVYSWKDLYPALVSALQLEKYATFFILALIILIASMNMLSLLFMYITNKRRDIALLRAMGTSKKTISHIFLIIGMTISFCASAIGLLLAAIVGWLLERYPFITLPDTYYVTHMPIKMDWQLFVLIWIIVLVLSLLATWLPTRKINRINIAHILRFEA